MKIGEFREVIAQYSPEDVRVLAAELYKMIPKKQKEEEGLDELIIAFPESKKLIKKTAASKNLITEYSALRSEAYNFINNAWLGNYGSPNRTIPKASRSKWRVTAKKLAKSLFAIKGENSEEAAMILVEFYRMLSHACDYHTFNTENPFSAIGYKQSEFLESVLAYLFNCGSSDENLRLAVYVVLESNTDIETWSIQLHYALLRQLKSADMKESVLEQCEFFRTHYNDSTTRPFISNRFLLNYTKRSWGIDYSERSLNNSAELYLIISISLHEYDKGIKFFQKHYKRGNPEVNLYALLEILYMYVDDTLELRDRWLALYDAAVAKGISPRDRLVERHEELLTQDTL